MAEQAETLSSQPPTEEIKNIIHLYRINKRMFTGQTVGSSPRFS